MISSEQMQDVTWRDPQGKPLTCSEKTRVLNDSLNEAMSAAQVALDDAVLMGCDAEQYRQAMCSQLLRLLPSVRERSA